MEEILLKANELELLLRELVSSYVKEELIRVYDQFLLVLSESADTYSHERSMISNTKELNVSTGGDQALMADSKGIKGNIATDSEDHLVARWLQDGPDACPKEKTKKRIKSAGDIASEEAGGKSGCMSKSVVLTLKKSVTPHIEEAGVDSKQSIECVLCDLVDVSDRIKSSYENWDDFAEHCLKVHSIYDETTLKDKEIAVVDNKLMDKNGVHIKAKKLLRQYSRLTCSLCGSAFSARRSYRDSYTKLCFHLHKQHSIPLPKCMSKLQCHLCNNYETHSQDLLTAHIQYNHSDRFNKKNQRVSCLFCGKSYLQRHIAKHMESIHNISNSDSNQNVQGNLPCPHQGCNKMIKGKSNLDSHIKRVHKQALSHLCHLCSYKCFLKRELLVHLYHNHNMNPENKPVYRCDVDKCDFTSITNDKMKRHNTQLHADKLYLCTYCGKSFSTSHNLRQHHLVKHSEADGKYYKCPKCPYKAHALQYVRRHMKIHSAVKKHKCDVMNCSYATHFHEDLIRHKQLHYKVRRKDRIYKYKAHKSKSLIATTNNDQAQHLQQIHDAVEPVSIPSLLDTQTVIPRVVPVDMDSCSQAAYNPTDDGTTPSYMTLV